MDVIAPGLSRSCVTMVTTACSVQAPEAVVENRPQKRKMPNLAEEPEFLDRLHRVEKHIRKNNLRATFTDQLGRTGALDEVASLNEAHQLAFYLFWNIKTDFDR